MNESELYTITKQYHEKKGIDIWVVRLEVKVDDNTFAELKSFAKELRGYYSNFKGVNGFVFKSEEEAEDFGEKLDDTLQFEEIEVDDEEEIDFPEYTEVEIETPKTVRGGKTEGSNEATETNLQVVKKSNIAGAPSKLPPAIEFILQTMVTKGYYQQLANYDEWDGKCQELVQNFVLETGFNEELVLTTFGCIVNGLSWESSISDFTQELDSRLQKLSLLRPSSRAPEEEWDSFLSKRIQWKIDPLEYGIKVKASVVTDKGQKTLNVYVELSNCNYQKVELNTTIFDVNGLIKGTDTLLYSKIVDKYEVAQSTFWLKCSVTKINKIVISGKIKQLLGNE